MSRQHIMPTMYVSDEETLLTALLTYDEQIGKLLGLLSTFRKDNFATTQVLSDNTFICSNQLIYWCRPKPGKKTFEFSQSISEEGSMYEISLWIHSSITTKNMLTNTSTSSTPSPRLRLKQRLRVNAGQFSCMYPRPILWNLLDSLPEMAPLPRRSNRLVRMPWRTKRG
jgi:hypothetical protein